MPDDVRDFIFKGVVGKVLDTVPMDPEHRVALQKTSAVVSGTVAGRSISIWAGLTNPVLLIGGLTWGLFAAANIKADAPAREVIERSKPADPPLARTARHVPLPPPLEPESPTLSASQ